MRLSSPAKSGAGGVSHSTGRPRSVQAKSRPGAASHGTLTTAKAGVTGVASRPSSESVTGTPQRAAKAARFSALRTSTPVTTKRSGSAWAMRMKKSVRQPAPMIANFILDIRG